MRGEQRFMTTPSSPQLAPYACAPTSRRLVPEKRCALRSDFARDRDRISRSYALRRLKGTTQVLPSTNHPTFRTRLTHSMEVAQTARILARNLGVDEDLAEAVALAHDLGHPPFGHSGEDALRACVAPWFTFNHNDQTFRWITQLEKSYTDFDGLNLCWDTLEGVVKHNGPLLGLAGSGDSAQEPPPETLPTILYFSQKCMDLRLDVNTSLEAQLASVADDITYTCHDIEDAIEADLMTLDDLLSLPFYYQLYASKSDVFRNFTGKVGTRRVVFDLVRQTLTLMVEDVVKTTTEALSRAQPKSVEDIRHHPGPLVQFSDFCRGILEETKVLLTQKVYQNPRLKHGRQVGAQKLTALFEYFIHRPEALPPRWQPPPAPHLPTTYDTARAVADYLASRTECDVDDLMARLSLSLPHGTPMKPGIA